MTTPRFPWPRRRPAPIFRPRRRWTTLLTVLAFVAAFAIVLAVLADTIAGLTPAAPSDDHVEEPHQHT